MLPNLQRQFKAYVAERDEAFARAVRDTSKADRRILLAVYRDGYVLRLHECLESDYPGIRAMLGEAEFLALARAYIDVHPSRHPNVRWFGRALADFLATWAAPARVAAMVDMARFEWALGEAQDAADAEPLGFGDLAGLPAEAWSTLTLQLHPSVRRLRLSAQAPQAWLRREETPNDVLMVDVEAQPVEWLIWRHHLDAQFRSMTPDEARAFDAASSGAPFPAICAALGGLVAEEEIPARAAGLLRAWVEAGVVVGRNS